MSSEKFSLKWNDFESNISSAFRELRTEKDLFDCTLSCGGRKVQAHKLILSACSNFFRSVFRENVHQHPLIYLRGVTYSDMVSALDFMYHGEVSVAQTNLNSFLALAEDLEIKGLTQNHGGPAANTQRVKPSEVRGRRAVSASNNENSDDIMEIKSEAATSQATVSYSEDYQDRDPAFYDSQHPPGEENSYQPLDASQDVVSSHATAIGGGKYSCSLCPFSARDKYNMRRHLELKHELTAGYQCDLCHQLFKAKHQLAVHKGRGCGFTNL